MVEVVGSAISVLAKREAEETTKAGQADGLQVKGKGKTSVVSRGLGVG